MSLYRSMIADGEDDPFYGPHMRHMRQMNNMMNSLFSDPFGMFGGESPLSLMGSHHGGAIMPFMPQMPSLNRLFRADLDGGPMGAGSSFSSSTVIMSSGPNGSPQVFSSSSSTNVGPNGIKETRKTLEDSRTGTKKMSIGHHIGERAHLIEREQNVYTGDAEEHQEFINLEEDEAETFDKEFQVKAGSMSGSERSRAAICAAPPRRYTQRLALPAPPTSNGSSSTSGYRRQSRPSARRPIRSAAATLSPYQSTSVREVYGGSHPQRHRHRHHKSDRHATQDN